jgi:hypothetical protein
VTSAKEILVQEIGRLSEKDAQEVLDLLRTRKAATVTPAMSKLTREELLRRAEGHPGIHSPDLNASPFEKIEPIETRGIPASQMLIADRR